MEQAAYAPTTTEIVDRLEAHIVRKLGALPDPQNRMPLMLMRYGNPGIGFRHERKIYCAQYSPSTNAVTLMQVINSVYTPC